MKLFLDSAETDEISEGLAHWDIDGITTNPRHIATSGKPRHTVLQEIAALVAGTDKPVSVEIDPHLQIWSDMVEHAVKLSEMSSNFVIKVGAGEEGFRAVRELSQRGIRTNLTLVFSVAQAWHAARSGATYVSPFVGWKEAHGDDGLTLVADIALMLANGGYPTLIIASAIRNARQFGDAAVAGRIVPRHRLPFTATAFATRIPTWDTKCSPVPGTAHRRISGLIVELMNSCGVSREASPSAKSGSVIELSGIRMRNDPEVQQAVNSYQLGLPRMPTAGRSGELMGRGTGSSLEFQEYREYLPGDDIRHLDWSAYARSDALMVRMYREEISPRTEILFDASRSMTTGDGTKARLTRQLASLFAQLSGRTGGRPTLIPLRDDRPVRPMGLEGLDALERMEMDAVGTLSDLLDDRALPLKPQAVRIVISDFLFPHDPGTLIRRLAAGASALWVMQLLTAWESDPTEVGGRRLVDIERGVQTDLIVNRKAIAEYKGRLFRLQEELARDCRRVHAPFVILIAEHGLPKLCREDLCAAGILRVG